MRGTGRRKASKRREFDHGPRISHLQPALALGLVFLAAFCPVAQAQRPPVLITPPQSQLVLTGTNVTFTVVLAPSTYPLTYQWSFSGQAIAGATTTALALTNVTVGQGGSYSVTVVNADGSIAAGATLSVVGVTQNPPSVSVGATITLQTGYGGAPNPGFQWQYSGTNLMGATSQLSVIPNVQLNDASAYTLVVTNAYGSLTLPITLNIDPTFTKITMDPVVQPATGVGPLANYPDGLAWADYNNSGYLDLLVWNQTAQEPHAGHLYLNNTNGTFSPARNTAINPVFDAFSAATWADFDNDGYPDLLVSRSGHSQLFRNNHDGTFISTSAGQLTSQVQSGAIGVTMDSAWADYDNDGLVDVILDTSLYRNNGDGTFTNVTGTTLGPKFASASGDHVWGDYDNDGYPDVFVAEAYSGNQRNLLYHNNGDGTFTERAAAASVNNGVYTFEAGWADYDNDGFLDLFVVNGDPLLGNFLYHNNGNGTFTRSAAFDAVSPPNVGTYGIAWGDYDNDGFLDLFLSNYGTPNNAESTFNLLYHNNGDGTFTRTNAGSLTSDADSFGGCSWADYNNDGFLDLYVTSQSGNNLLYRNNGNSNGWLEVKCSGKVSNGAGIGAKVRVNAFYRGASRWQLREINGGDSDGVSQPLLAHFGLGDATNIDIVRIEWPSGIVQEMTNVAPKQFLIVQEQGVAVFPRVQNLVPGSNSTFTAKATFGAPSSYQWQFNGTNLPGETNATLVIQGAQASNVGGYTVVLTQAGVPGSVSSSPALLRSTGPPIITTQPQSQLVAAGSNVTLSTGLEPSATPLSYQWYNYYPITGATGPTLVLTNIALGASGVYGLAITNNAGSNYTAATVNVVTVQPPYQSVSLGVKVVFTVSWSPVNAGVTLQWLLNGTNLPGATKATFSITNTQVSDAGTYSLVASNAFGTLTFPAVLTVDPTFTKITTGPVVTEVGWSAGASWGDYDNDGFIDLFVGRVGGLVNLLFRNNGDGTFTRITTSAVGSIITDAAASRAPVWGDYDNDGFLDLFVSERIYGYTFTGVNYGTNFLYHNNGNGTFTRVLTNGPIVTDTADSTGAVWGDYDNDGLLDLFVTHANSSPDGGMNVLYRNNGDGTFSKASAGSVTGELSNSRGASWGDFNNDGLLDLFVANQLDTNANARPNFLYLNLGGGVFQKITAGSIVTDRSGSFGCAWGDYDNDGYLDLFVANDTGQQSLGINGAENHNFLYHNNGDGTFTRVTNSVVGAIITDPALALDCAWGDYDNDGYLDLFVANGDGPYNYLYHNNGDGTFGKITTGSLVNDQDPAQSGSSSCTWGDYDNDGFLDLFASNDQTEYTNNAVNYLYHNNGPNNGNTNGWLKVKCVGVLSNRSGIGAKVRVLAAINFYQTPWQMREISGGGGYRSQSGALLAHFGLGTATNINVVRIEWPSGIVQEMTNVPVKQALTVQEQGVAIFPRVQNLAAGSNSTFTARTTFSGSLHYQWQFDGADLPGETNLTLVVPGAQASNVGGYTVVVTQAGLPGSVSSSPALLRLPGPPVIAVQPQSQTAMVGGQVTFTVGVVPSATPLSYQWLENNVPIPRATFSTLVLTNIDSSAAGTYSVNVINYAGSTNSAAATLTVAPPFQLLALPLADGLFPLRLEGAAGTPFVLQSSTNLLDWLPILTNVITTNGTFDFVDPDSPLLNRRFYRGVMP